MSQSLLSSATEALIAGLVDSLGIRRAREPATEWLQRGPQEGICRGTATSPELTSRAPDISVTHMTEKG